MNEQDVQRLFSVIAVLTARLGGKVEISDAELENPPHSRATQSRIGKKIIIEVVE